MVQTSWASCKRASRRWFSTGVDTNECLDSQIPLSSLNPDTSAHRHPWTLTHGFYAAMGVSWFKQETLAQITEREISCSANEA
ncbi:hypothetical protein VTO58DRAFT_108496 [Aureobasidium pullulans]